MPIIKIDLLDGKSTEQKNELISKITKVTEEILNVDKDAIKILLTEIRREHWAVGGTTLKEKLLNNNK